ncbi:unnamed protein product [Gongylonema pulchrum]|uniref:DDE Tnp4 domain-containing protein n=1 Tax=Gongylonema pulchrum TaxID=637853 RepID=A0A183EB91_9BILA|nr:unnamed protein product [Gongylonema pulchrum]
MQWFIEHHHTVATAYRDKYDEAVHPVSVAAALLCNNAHLVALRMSGHSPSDQCVHFGPSQFPLYFLPGHACVGCSFMLYIAQTDYCVLLVEVPARIVDPDPDIWKKSEREEAAAFRVPFQSKADVRADKVLRLLNNGGECGETGVF